jgi:hypothetical protein
MLTNLTRLRIPFFAVCLAGSIFLCFYLPFRSTGPVKSSGPFRSKETASTGFSAETGDTINVRTILHPTKSFIERGQRLYLTHCSSCHGKTGSGDGPDGAALFPRPRNFHDTSSWKNGRSLTGMYAVLDEGILRSGMPSYNHLPPTERFAVILYLRTLTDDFPPMSKEEMEKLMVQYHIHALYQ